MKKIITDNNEKIIGSWTLNCIAFEGNKMLGKLYITDENLYFEGQFDSTLGGLIGSVVVSAISASGHALLVSPEIAAQWKDKGYLKISKKNIKSIEEESSFFKKTVNVTLQDDSKVIFDYGMLSVKKLADSIRS